MALFFCYKIRKDKRNKGKTTSKLILLLPSVSSIHFPSIHVHPQDRSLHASTGSSIKGMLFIYMQECTCDRDVGVRQRPSEEEARGVGP